MAVVIDLSARLNEMLTKAGMPGKWIPPVGVVSRC